MNRIGILALLLLGISFPGFGQFSNTNDWIDFSQEFFKVPVIEDGIHQLDKNDLKNAGMPVASISDDKYHMFHNGEEIPIYVTGGSITFYGETAKGDLDFDLYENADNQAHQEFSIYADTGYYYLTYNSSPGLRYTAITSTDFTGLAKVASHHQVQAIAFKDVYSSGSRVNATLFHPEMALGEGLQSSNAFRTQSYVTADFDVSDFISGETGSMRTSICGTNNLFGRKVDSTDANGKVLKTFNNHAIIEANNGTWVPLAEKYFLGYSAHRFKSSISESDFDNGTLSLRARADESYNGTRIFRGSFSVSHFEIEYTAQTKILNGLEAEFRFDNTSSDRYIDASNFTGTQALVLDIENRTLMNTDNGGGALKFRVNQGSKDHHIVIADVSAVKKASARKYTFNEIDIPTGTNFLIISHRKLKASVTDYETFKASAAGGSFNVEVVYVDDIYNEYFFGYHHPLALRTFFADLLAQNKNPQNVFLIGKGLDVKHLSNGGVFDYTADLVPPIGSPSSDWYYLRYLDPSTVIPPFAISRLSASKDETVYNYLTKVKTYESLENARWRKNAVHVSGGKSGNELTRFSGYMSTFGDILEGPNLGANITYFGKESSLEIDDALTDFILEDVNAGVGFFSYFGHAGSNVTEVDLSTPINYHNANSPMVMYFGGCVLGSSYEESPLLGEEFIGAPTGAVSWIAAGSFSFEPSVYEYTLRFYENVAYENYGQNIGDITRQTIRDFMVEGDDYKEAQAWLTLIQGDPTIKIYSPDLPDYEITNADVYITPDDVTAQSDSFFVNMDVKNHGRATTDSFSMVYNLVYPSGISKKDTIKLPGVYNSRTMNFTFFNDRKEFGNYRIEIILDEANEVAEIRENNNKASYSFTLISNGATGLFPPDYGIVSETELELVGQSLDINSLSNTYIFELDTTATFLSPWRKQSGEVKGDLIGSWKVKLLQTDSQDYYWRMRMKLSDGTLSPWSQKSFSHIKNSLDGWAQIDFKQLSTATPVDMYADTSKRNFRFVRITSPGQFIMANHGRDYPTDGYYQFGVKSPSNDAKIIRNNKYAQINGNRTLNGVVCFVISPNMDENDNFAPYLVDAGVDRINGEYQFDWMSSTEEIIPEVLDSFISFLNRVPRGYHIFAYSGYYHRIGDMPDRFYQALEEFGSSKIRKLENDDVWLFIGSKGLKPGSAFDEQVTSDQDSLLLTSTTFTVTKYNGSMGSQIIGPSKKWRQLSISTDRFNSERASVDNSYSIVGIRLDGSKEELVSNFKQNSLDLSFIDAKEFPYLQMELKTSNQYSYLPAQPRRWIVNYDYLPEGLVNSQLAFKFNSDTIQKGQVLDFEIGYQNISTLSLDDIVVNFRIIDKDRQEMYQDYDTLKALAPGQSTVIKKSFNSENLINDNKLIVLTNPGLLQPELYAFNNNYERSFFVEGDHELPIMEVTFDGHRILDGDIVSPTPSIVITGKDNNSYFLLDDPGYFDITLEYPDSILPKNIYGFSPGVTFYPAEGDNKTARIEYNPESLPDGKYTLNVQLSDASGNESGKVQYRVNFEVVGASTISHFYPYPNPFSSQMRFVYTLTGDQIPDDIVIQILTVSGKIVKEIHKDELGDIKIGHNVSDYTWDGTDTYGNKLANGVYLYRVKTVMDGANMEHRVVGNNPDNTEAAMRQGFGKIYILR